MKKDYLVGSFMFCLFVCFYFSCAVVVAMVWLFLSLVFLFFFSWVWFLNSFFIEETEKGHEVG